MSTSAIPNTTCWLRQGSATQDPVRAQQVQVSLQEARLALREAKQATGDGADFIAGNNGDSVFNYGEPRQYRFGVEVRF